MHPHALDMLKREMREDRFGEIACIETEHEMAVVGAACHLYLYHPDDENDKDKWEIVAASIDTGASQTMMSTGMAEAIGLSRIGSRTIRLAVGTAECEEFGPCSLRIADMRNRFYSRAVSLTRVTTTSDRAQRYAGVLLGRDALGHFDLEYQGPRGQALLRQPGDHS